MCNKSSEGCELQHTACNTGFLLGSVYEGRGRDTHYLQSMALLRMEWDPSASRSLTGADVWLHAEQLLVFHPLCWGSPHYDLVHVTQHGVMGPSISLYCMILSVKHYLALPTIMLVSVREH